MIRNWPLLLVSDRQRSIGLRVYHREDKFRISGRPVALVIGNNPLSLSSCLTDSGLMAFQATSGLRIVCSGPPSYNKVYPGSFDCCQRLRGTETSGRIWPARGSALKFFYLRSSYSLTQRTCSKKVGLCSWTTHVSIIFIYANSAVTRSCVYPQSS